MKQQKNYVKYKRNKVNGARQCKSGDIQTLVLAKDQRVPIDTLLLVSRIKESRNATPQAQKILFDLGLKEINNCAFIMSTTDNIKKLLLISNYVAYGQPEKKTIEDLLRKRGYLKTADHKRVPFSDNVLIEELLGANGIICLEDCVDALWNCKKNQKVYEAVKNAVWPF
jgi:large subunit ribosomal protein L7e